MTDLHTAANRLMDCWADEDRERYSAVRHELEQEGGESLSNTAHAVARWQIKQYRKKGRLPDWRQQWIEQTIGEDDG